MYGANGGSGDVNNTSGGGSGDGDGGGGGDGNGDAGYDGVSSVFSDVCRALKDEFLVELGMKDAQGKTPLHIAVTLAADVLDALVAFTKVAGTTTTTIANRNVAMHTTTAMAPTTATTMAMKTVTAAAAAAVVVVDSSGTVEKGERTVKREGFVYGDGGTDPFAQVSAAYDAVVKEKQRRKAGGGGGGTRRTGHLELARRLELVVERRRAAHLLLLEHLEPLDQYVVQPLQLGLLEV